MLNISMTSSITTAAVPESEVKYIPSLSHNSSALNSSMNASSVLDVSTASSRGGMRSLAAAYNAADRSFRVDQEPLKDQSLMNRLWGYVAGQ